jgi:UDP-N-acetylmuramoyl-L-alanyl-D-glutamate--2,6-diaminopimelate ligase
VIVAEHPAKCKGTDSDAVQKASCVGVRDSREALALISSAFYGHPSRHLSLVGITGTNGKTTTAFITRAIIEAAGARAGLIGTICYMTGSRRDNALNTTPESLDLQRYLSEMVENSLSYGVVEVSSHALALSRVSGCSFHTAAFTSFSQDHLDFHHTMDGYFDTKRKLFDGLDAAGTAVLNWDDERIRTLASDLQCRVVTVGTEPGAMIRAGNIAWGGTGQDQDGRASGISFDVTTPDSTFRVASRMMGLFNVTNLLVSIGIARSLGISDDAIQRGVRGALPVEGRFEPVDEGQNFLCIIDYAHTDDALRKLVQEARRITPGRIITVFGCGGDRDRTKRPLMGRAASELSDMVIVTSDNPRSEDPSGIISDILRGIQGVQPRVVPDREEAIADALRMAREGDTVLIAGKGHENYQEIMGVRHHFSDRETATGELMRMLHPLDDQEGGGAC